MASSPSSKQGSVKPMRFASAAKMRVFGRASPSGAMAGLLAIR